MGKWALCWRKKRVGACESSEVLFRLVHVMAILSLLLFPWLILALTVTCEDIPFSVSYVPNAVEGADEVLRYKRYLIGRGLPKWQPEKNQAGGYRSKETAVQIAEGEILEKISFSELVAAGQRIFEEVTDCNVICSA